MKYLLPTLTATTTLGLALGLCFLDSSSAGAVTVAYYPSDDTWINSLLPTTNYGNDPQMTIGRTTTGSGASLNITSQQIPFLKFAIPTLPSNIFAGNVTARLFLTYPNTTNTVRAISGYNVLQNWSEGSLTYSNCTTGGTACSNLISPTALFNRTVTGTGNPPVTQLFGSGLNDLVSGWLNGSQTNDGLALRVSSTSPTSGGSKQFWTSEENAPGDVRPRLEITYDEFSSLGWVLEPRIGQNSPGTTNVNGSWEASTHPPDIATVNSGTPVGSSTEVGFIWQDNTEVPFTIDWNKNTGVVTTTIAGITKTLEVGTGVGYSTSGGTVVSTFVPQSTIWQALRLITSVDPSAPVQVGTSITTSLTSLTYQFGSQTLTTDLSSFGIGSTATATVDGQRVFKQSILSFDDISGVILEPGATALQVQGKVKIDWPGSNPQLFSPNGANNKIYARFEAYGPNNVVAPPIVPAGIDPQAVPEPKSVAGLLALGLVGAGLRLRRNAKSF